jgi:hypothetical protein
MGMGVRRRRALQAVASADLYAGRRRPRAHRAWLPCRMDHRIYDPSGADSARCGFSSVNSCTGDFASVDGAPTIGDFAYWSTNAAFFSPPQSIQAVSRAATAAGWICLRDLEYWSVVDDRSDLVALFARVCLRSGARAGDRRRPPRSTRPGWWCSAVGRPREACSMTSWRVRGTCACCVRRDLACSILSRPLRQPEQARPPC